MFVVTQVLSTRFDKLQTCVFILYHIRLLTLMQQSSHPFFTNVFLASNESLFVSVFHICFLQHCSKARKSLPLFNQFVLNIIWYYQVATVQSTCHQQFTMAITSWSICHFQQCSHIFGAYSFETFTGPTPILQV